VNMFMTPRYVVTALFVRSDLISAAKIGRSNPWADAQQRALSAPFTNFGLKSPFSKKEYDPLFMIEVGERSLGYSRVFETKRLALMWLLTLVEKQDVYGYWRNGAPVGPFGTPEEYKGADQFVDQIIVHCEKALTVRGAAEAALKRVQSHFDEPLCYWNRAVHGGKIFDGVSKALATE